MQIPTVTFSCPTHQHDDFEVIELRVRDAISDVLHITLTAILPAGSADHSFLGRSGIVTIQSALYGSESFSGLVTAERLTGTDRDQHGSYQTLIQLTIHSNLFAQAKTVACSVMGVPKPLQVQDFVRRILDRKNVVTPATPNGLPAFPDKVEFRLQNDHPPLGNLVQVNRSNLDFLLDVIGQMGIFYLRNPAAGVSPAEAATLIFTDGNDCFQRNDEPLRFITSRDKDLEQSYLYEFSRARSLGHDVLEVLSTSTANDVSENAFPSVDQDQTYPQQYYVHDIDQKTATYLLDIVKRHAYHRANSATALCDRPDIRVGQIVEVVSRDGATTSDHAVTGLDLHYVNREDRKSLATRLVLHDPAVAFATADPMVRAPATGGTEATAVVEGPNDRAYLDDQGHYFVKYNLDRKQRAVGAGSAPTSSRLKTANGGAYEHSPLPPGTEVTVAPPGSIFAKPYITARSDHFGHKERITSKNTSEHIHRTVSGTTVKVVDGPYRSDGSNEASISFETRMTGPAGTPNLPVYLRLGTSKFEMEKTEDEIAGTAAWDNMEAAAKFAGTAVDLTDPRGHFSYSPSDHMVLVDEDYVLAVCRNLVERVMANRIAVVHGDNVVITTDD